MFSDTYKIKLIDNVVYEVYGKVPIFLLLFLKYIWITSIKLI